MTVPARRHGTAAHVTVTAPIAVRAAGAVYVTPLTVVEFARLNEVDHISWRFGGWALTDELGYVHGWHWHDPLDPRWNTPEVALAAFLPGDGQREQLLGRGWRVRRDTDSALLTPYLCDTTDASRGGRSL